MTADGDETNKDIRELEECFFDLSIDLLDLRRVRFMHRDLS